MRDRVGEVLRGGHQYDEEPTPAFPGVYSGTVTKTTAQGVHFTVPSYSADQEFGPAPWPQLANHVHDLEAGGDPSHAHGGQTEEPDALGNPPRGTQVAVAFADGDADKPLVLAVYGWPS